MQQKSHHHWFSTKDFSAFRGAAERHFNSCRRFRRHPACRGKRPGIRSAHASYRSRAARDFRACRATLSDRKRLDAGVSRRRRGRVQDRGSDFTASLSRWISYHWHLWAVRFRSSLRQAAEIRSGKNVERVWLDRQPVWRAARKLRHHDEAFPSRARR